MRGDGGVGWFALLYSHFGLGHLLVVFCGFHLLWGEGGVGDRGWWRISWLYWSLQKKWKLQRDTHTHTHSTKTHTLYTTMPTYAHLIHNSTHHTQLCIHAYMYAHINPVTKQVSKICILFTISLLKFCIDSVEKQNFFQMMWNGMFFPLKKTSECTVLVWRIIFTDQQNNF